MADKTRDIQTEYFDNIAFLKHAQDATSWIFQPGQGLGMESEKAVYDLFCAQTGDPCSIAPELLIGDGALTREEWDCMELDPDEQDEQESKENRYILLTMAYERSDISRVPGFRRYLEQNGWWLEEYALFLALDKLFGGKDWRSWPEDIRTRCGYAMDHYRREFYFDIEFQMYLQYMVFRQRNRSNVLQGV